MSRRALTNRALLFCYAFAGDDGVVAGAKTSAEAASALEWGAAFREFIRAARTNAGGADFF
jgi:hypothetical protein